MCIIMGMGSLMQVNIGEPGDKTREGSVCMCVCEGGIIIIMCVYMYLDHSCNKC